MAWQYKQSTGELTDPNKTIIGKGYSGNGTALNNPNKQNIEDHGPIPQGNWTIGTFFNDIGGKGEVVAHLKPNEKTNTFEREGFMIHGDNKKANFSASEGCIILSRSLREAIMNSKDTVLSVIA